VRRIEDFTHVVFKSGRLLEDHGTERRARHIVVRQDRLMPITYVERHYYDVVEVKATMMPVGSEMIHAATKQISMQMLKYEVRAQDLKFHMYRELRYQLMDVAEKDKEVIQ